jgi:hypothetical protein
MQTQPIYYQQGDCLIKPIGKFGVFTQEFEEIPKNAKPLKTNLVLKGSTNSHALYNGEFELFEADGIIFIDAKTEITLDHVKDHLVSNPMHAEHHAQTIAAGKYFVPPLMEFDHLKEESRQVID